MNTKQLDAVGDIVGLMLAQALTPIRRELLALSEKLAALPAPVAGVTLAEVEQRVNDLAVGLMSGIERSVAEAVDALPVPKDGTSVSVDDLRPVVAEQVKAAVKALPVPKDGTSVTLEQVQPLVDAAVKALPVPKDGTSVSVDDLRPVVAEQVEAAVKALPAPKDGVGLAGAMIDRDGNLQITLTDGTTKDLGPVVGKSLDAFVMEYLPETHEVRFKATCAGRAQEERFPAGGIHLGSDNGYWREGVKAKALEAYSFDGCLWVARAATTAKPGPTSGDWVLAARQGRRGDPGKDFNAPRPPDTIKVGS